MKRSLLWVVALLATMRCVASYTLQENDSQSAGSAVEWGTQAEPARAAYDEAIGLLSKGRQPDAEKTVDGGCEAFPDSQRLWFLRAVLYRSRFHKSDAFQSFSKAYALGATNLLGQVAMLSVSLDHDLGVDAGLESLRNLVAGHPDEILVRWLFAIQCRTHRLYSEEAAHQYEWILQQWNPGPVMVNHTYANILTESLKQPEKALPFRERALALSQRGWTYQGYANTLMALKRYEEASAAFEKAVEIEPDSNQYRRQWGNCLAQLGKKYEDGEGVDRNYAVAVEWYRKAKDQGSSIADRYLGMIYTAGGYGIDRNLDKAEAWLKKRAVDSPVQEGDPVSYCQIGSLLFAHPSTPGNMFAYIDYRRTCSGLKRTSEKGDRDATELLAWMYAVCADPSFKKGETAVQMASELCGMDGSNPQWRSTLAAALARTERFDEAVAQQQMAIDLLSPERSSSDEGKGYAARLELYKASKAYSAYCGFTGRAGTKVEEQSRSVVDQTAKDLFLKGYSFEEGGGVEKDYAQALDWYRQAADGGYSQALASMGRMYADGGFGIDRDLAKATELLAAFIVTRPATTGRWSSSYGFGNLRIRLLDLPGPPSFQMDYARTIAECKKLAEQGYDDSKEFLAWLYAACPASRFRDGAAAVRLAGELCQKDGSNPQWRNTLAAACARVGNFDEAVGQQEQALALLSPERRASPEGKAYAERLEFYKQHQPFPPD